LLPANNSLNAGALVTLIGVYEPPAGVPYSKDALLPQQYCEPFPRIQIAASVAVMLVTVGFAPMLNEETTGIVLFVPPPFPICPLVPRPQQ
jgi:hypothetical protein